MQHALLVDVLKPLDNLTEDKLGILLLQLSASAHIGQKVTTSADLHHVDDVGLNLKALVEANDIRVACSLQNVVLLPHFFERVLVLHKRFIDRFQGDEFASQPVNGQVDLAERALADHLSDFVVVDFCVKDSLSDVCQDRIVDQLLRSQWPRVDLEALHVRLGGRLFLAA